MIKKLKKQNTWGEYLEKLNELIDAVNEIMTWRFETDEDSDWYDDPKYREQPADPYAEQRKWIGKLCWFSNGDGFDEVGYLTEIDPDMPEEKFRCDCYDYYKECKPVKPTDSIIYKGDNNE